MRSLILNSFWGATLSVTLVACGGSSSDSESLPSGEQPGPIGDNPIDFTAENYVSFASAMYQSTLSLGAALPLPALFEIGFLPLQTDDIFEDCDEGGAISIEYDRPVFDDLLRVSDTVTTRFDRCADDGEVQDGSSVSEIIALDRSILNIESSMVISAFSDITVSGSNDAGRYFSDMNIYTAQSDILGLSYVGINIAPYYNARPSAIDQHPFADVLQAYVGITTDNNLDIVTPSANFADFFFETITDDVNDFGDTFVNFSMTIEYPDNSLPSLTITSDNFMRITEREEGDSSVNFADGSFSITLSDGKAIQVTSNINDGVGVDVLEEATISADIDGDGTFELSEQMSWQEFESAFLIAAFQDLAEMN